MWSFSSNVSGKYRRMEIHLNTALCWSQCIFLFLASSSQVLLCDLDRKCIAVKEVSKKTKEGNHLGGEIVWLKWNEGDWKWHLKWALIF